VWSDEDEGFIATVPELKNLSAFGETYEEAVKEVKDVIEGYIETLEEDNIDIPAPSTLSCFSGQTRIRMPKKLHQLLSIEAEREGVSLNMLMVTLLSLNYGLALKKNKSKDVFMVYLNDNKTANYDLRLPNGDTSRFSGSGQVRLNNNRNKVGEGLW